MIFLPEEANRTMDPKALVPLEDIDYSVERKGNAVIVRKHYPPPIGDRRMAPAVRVYPTRDQAIRVFDALQRQGRRGCTNFYYKTRQEWQDREQANAWTDRPSLIEVPGRPRA